MATSKKQLLEQVKQGDLAGAVQSMLDQMTQLQIVTRIVNDGEAGTSADTLPDSQKICTHINILEGTIDTAVGSGFLSEGAYSSLADGHMHQVAAGCASVRDNIESLQTLMDLAEQATWEGEEAEDVSPVASQSLSEIAIDDVADQEDVTPKLGLGDAALLGGGAIAAGAAGAALADLGSVDEELTSDPAVGFGDDLSAELGGDLDDAIETSLGETDLLETGLDDVGLGDALSTDGLGEAALFGDADLGEAVETPEAEVGLPGDLSGAELESELPDALENALEEGDNPFGSTPAADIEADALDLGLGDDLASADLAGTDLAVDLANDDLSAGLSNDLSAGLDGDLGGDLGSDLGDGDLMDLGGDLSEALSADLGADLGADLSADLGENANLDLGLDADSNSALPEGLADSDPGQDELGASALDGLDLGGLELGSEDSDDALAGLDLGGEEDLAGEASVSDDLAALDLGSDSLGADSADLFEVPSESPASSGDDDLMAGLLSQPVVPTSAEDSGSDTELLTLGSDENTEFFEAPTEPSAESTHESNGLDLGGEDLQADPLEGLDLEGDFAADFSSLQDDVAGEDTSAALDNADAFAALDAEPLDLGAAEDASPAPDFGLEELQIEAPAAGELEPDPEVDALALESIDDFDSNLWDEASADATPEAPQAPQRVSRSLESLFAADDNSQESQQKAETEGGEADPLSALFSDTSLQDLEGLSSNGLGVEANGDSGSSEQNPFELDSLESDPFADLMVEED